MQTLKFIRRTHGTSQKGNDYDMTEVSNGLNSFTLSNAAGVGKKISDQNLEVGQEFKATIHVSVVYGALRGTIVDVSFK